MAYSRGADVHGGRPGFARAVRMVAQRERIHEPGLERGAERPAKLPPGVTRQRFDRVQRRDPRLGRPVRRPGHVREHTSGRARAADRVAEQQDIDAAPRRGACAAAAASCSWTIWSSISPATDSHSKACSGRSFAAHHRHELRPEAVDGANAIVAREAREQLAKGCAVGIERRLGALDQAADGAPPPQGQLVPADRPRDPVAAPGSRRRRPRTSRANRAPASCRTRWALSSAGRLEAPPCRTA